MGGGLWRKGVQDKRDYCNLGDTLLEQSVPPSASTLEP